MMDGLGKALLTIFGGITLLALVSVLISKKSDTPAIIQAGASALANVVSAATSPVSTATTNGNLGINSFTTPGAIPNLGTIFGSTP